MAKKLTTLLDDSVHKYLHDNCGSRGIGKFISKLVKQYRSQTQGKSQEIDRVKMVTLEHKMKEPIEPVKTVTLEQKRWVEF